MAHMGTHEYMSTLLDNCDNLIMHIIGQKYLHKDYSKRPSQKISSSLPPKFLQKMSSFANRHSHTSKNANNKHYKYNDPYKEQSKA